jgi:DNA-binding transcriptional regulator GbsR (MarR family)
MARDLAPDETEAGDAELMSLVALPACVGPSCPFQEAEMGSEEIAKWTGLSGPSVRKHPCALLKLGMVSVKDRVARRGVQKLHFVVSRSAWITEEDDPKLSRRRRQTVDLGLLRSAVEDSNRAIRAPRHGARPSRMVANVPATVDEQAWQEISELHHQLLEQVMEVVEAGGRRLVENGGEPVTITTTLLLLEVPGEPARD